MWIAQIFYIMAKTRAEKEQIVSELVEHLKKMNSLVLTSFSGLTAAAEGTLRRTCQVGGVKYVVVKQTLFTKALEAAGIKATLPFEGNVSALFAFEDATTPAKILKDFLKAQKEKVKILGGMLEGRVLSQNEVVELGKLPGRNELLARLVGAIRAPLSGLVQVLSGNTRKLVFVLSEIQKSKS